jgi:hypothetical protein
VVLAVVVQAEVTQVHQLQEQQTAVVVVVAVVLLATKQVNRAVQVLFTFDTPHRQPQDLQLQQRSVHHQQLVQILFGHSWQAERLRWHNGKLCKSSKQPN